LKNPLKGVLGHRPSSAADIENELGRLGQKLADHQRRRSEVLQALEEAKEARIAVLAEDDTIIAEATANVRRFEADAAEHARMIEEYETAIAGAEERFRQATDQEQRRAAAQKLEKTAEAVDAIAPELEKTVAALSSAVRKLRNVIPADLEVFPGHHLGRMSDKKGPADREDAISAAVAEMLLAAAPELFEQFSEGGYRIGLFRIMSPEAVQPDYASREAGIEPLAGRKAVEALISGRLRRRAALVLAGERPAALNDIKPVVKYVPPPSIPEVAVFPTKSFSYISTGNGLLTLVGRGWHRWVPEPVAKLAISRGFALAIDSPEGQKAFADAKAAHERGGSSGSSLSADQCMPLGDVLGLAAEYKRERAEFEARQAADDDADDGVDEARSIAGLDRPAGGVLMASPRGS
jgi:hypothetical protein